MGFFDKLKDIFKDDPTLDDPIETPEEAKPAEESKKEETPKSVSEHKPAAKVKKAAAEKTYIETLREAVTLICGYLGKYAWSADKNLAVLELWIIRRAESGEVSFADDNFVNELKQALIEDNITAVKKIELHTFTYREFLEIKKTMPDIEAIDATRLYYRTHAFAGSAVDAAARGKDAWLVCSKGEEFVEQPVYHMDIAHKQLWNIGRSRQPSETLSNDIVIKSEQTSVSRTHAAIRVIEGRYYLTCREGGLNKTKIFRQDGKAQSPFTADNFRELPPLSEGDIISLSGCVSLRFTLKQPE